MKKLQFLKAGMESGVSPAQFISINFEDLNYAYLQTAKALHNEITKRATEINGKAYLFFDEIPEVKDWEKCINSLRVSLDCDIYITGSNAKLLSSELSTYLGGRYVEFIIYPFSFAEFLELYRPIAPDEPIQKCFQSIFYLELLRRDYKVTVGKTGNKEIDFVCDNAGKNCMFRLPICWHPMKPSSVSLEHMITSVITTRNMLSLWMNST